MCADDGFVDASVTALEDLPVLVDEKVVADVVPAVALHVVHLDPAHDCGGLRGGIRVRAGRVMDERKLEGGCVAGRRTPDRLVRTPGLAVDQRWGAGQRNPPQRNPYFGTADEIGPQAGDTSAQPVLDPIGRSGPVGIAHTPAACGTRLGRTDIREILDLRVRALPGTPPSFERARAELHCARAAPVEANHVELRRRSAERAT